MKIKSPLIILIGWMSIWSVTSDAAQDGFEPILETLQYQQKQAYLKAAPSGKDDPLPKDVRSIVISDAAVDTVASSLERVAEVRTQELSLEEKRQSQALDQELQQFGYEIFDRAEVAQMLDSVSVPGDYVIGTGDTIVVQLYGKRNVEYRLVVTREGKLLIPEFGPLEVAGLEFSQVRELIIDGFKTRVIGAKTAVTMGDIRALQVRLTGDVKLPGIYTVNGLATLVDALLVSGGVKPSGSLRKIELLRQGEKILEFDLYDLLLRGDAGKDVSLRHNDVIFVPPIGEVVYVGGEVQRPAIYELKSSTTLPELLTMAGGALPTASMSSSYIERIVADRYRTLVNLADVSDLSSLELVAGDYLRVMPLDDRLDQVVMLSGHVKRPGGYQFQAGMRISDLVGSPDALLRNADLDFALLKRETLGLKRTIVQYVKLDQILRFPTSDANIQLQPRDELILFNLAGDRSLRLKAVLADLDIQATPYSPAQTMSLKGHFRFQGRFPIEQGIRLIDALKIGGGIMPGADMEYGVVFRTKQPSGSIEPIRFRLAEALVATDSDANLVIHPGDRIYLFDSALERSSLIQRDVENLLAAGHYLGSPKVVSSEGLVRQRGTYPLTPKMRASDLLCASDGLKLNAHGVSAELSRTHKSGNGQPRIEHIQLDAQYLVQLCGQRKQRANRIASDAMKFSMYRNEMPLKKEVFVEDIIDPIRFDTGVAKLAAAEIRQLETALQKYSSWDNKVRVIVAGHTDVTKLSASARNQYTDNHGLSLARAWEVANMIHSSLPSDVVIEVEGFGATKPVATNATRTGRALNRRVEVHFKIERQSKPEGIRLQEFQQQVVDYSIGIDAVFSEKDPLLQSGDQLTFVERSGWREVQQVTLSGEFTRPGIYVIDRGETLCSVVRRAGGLTSAAWSYGSEFTRLSTRKMQQQTLDGIQDQLDDLMMELSLSHSVNNDEKTPAAGDKDEYLKVLNRLKRAEPNGREVINLDKALTCDKRFDVILEGDDRLSVPVRPRQVSVMGQVYVPTSHAYINNRTIRDYIELSGGATVIGRLSDAYAVQANGEVLNMRGRGFKAFSRKKPEPGATIFVPLNVDRMNTTEKIQAWTRSLVEVALFAGVIL